MGLGGVFSGVGFFRAIFEVGSLGGTTFCVFGMCSDGVVRSSVVGESLRRAILPGGAPFVLGDFSFFFNSFFNTFAAVLFLSVFFDFFLPTGAAGNGAGFGTLRRGSLGVEEPDDEPDSTLGSVRLGPAGNGFDGSFPVSSTLI